MGPCVHLVQWLQCRRSLRRNVCRGEPVTKIKTATPLKNMCCQNHHLDTTITLNRCSPLSPNAQQLQRSTPQLIAKILSQSPPVPASHHHPQTILTTITITPTIITTITTYAHRWSQHHGWKVSTVESVATLTATQRTRCKTRLSFFYLLFFYLEKAPNSDSWNLWSTNIWSPSRLEPWCQRTCSPGPGANSSAVTEVAHLVQKVVLEVIIIET